ncbi:hypothetical protein [Tunturiibacter psychrotolerans]|uniref:hypothetical protein n=1 Tax=Tunturiibacter psychrotolerans TaxID=3069686 RepID=UPI003D1B71DA
MISANRVSITVGEPNWAPLEMALTRKECAAYMYMGRAGDIELYKHRVTRRYLNISMDGRSFYLYAGGHYVEVTQSAALDHVRN